MPSFGFIEIEHGGEARLDSAGLLYLNNDEEVRGLLSTTELLSFVCVDR